jgi:hypothetical protein
MGLLCLAQHKKSINILKEHIKEHITDRDVVTYCPGGCIVGSITVGGFARELLRNPNHLGHRRQPFSLISEDELIGLDIEILSKDSTISFHGRTARTLSNVLNEKGIALTLPDLKRYAPELESYQIIKAIGRLGVSPQQREFLISCVQDENLDHMSRLAAASALTRDANEITLAFIESNRTQLNRLTEGNWGDQFLETIKIRISHEKYMEVVRELSWRKKEKLDDAVLQAFSNSHPLAFPDLTNDRYHWLGTHHEKVCNIVGDSLVVMSRNLEEFNQPWNTYSDTAYALSFVITVYKGNLLFDHIFTQERRAEIERSVKKALENHFEEKQKSSDSKYSD